MLQNLGTTLDGHSRIQSSMLGDNAAATTSGLRSIDNQLGTSTPFHSAGGSTAVTPSAIATASSSSSSVVKKSGNARRRVVPNNKTSGGSRIEKIKNEEDNDDDDGEEDADTTFSMKPQTPGKHSFSKIQTNTFNKIKHNEQLAHCKDSGCLGGSKHSSIAGSGSVGGGSGNCHDDPSQNQQLQPTQQQLGKSDRISKEKQKFFRHSAFNSDRVVKTSPPAPNKVQRTNNNRTVSQARGAGTASPTPADDLYRSRNKLNHHHQTQAKGSRLSVSSTSTSSSGEDDDDDDDEDDDDDDDGESSSTESSTSTSSYNDSESSSTSNSSSSEGENGECPQGRVTGHTDGEYSKAKKQTATANCRKGAGAPRNSQDTSATWGFAAEAKKNLDIFNSSLLGGRVFGNFDGVDKDSLVKVAPSSSNKKNETTKQSGQLRGLFDSLTHVFATSDNTRMKQTPDYKIGGRRRLNRTQTSPIKDAPTRSSYRFFKEQSETLANDMNSINNKQTELNTESFGGSSSVRKLNSFGVNTNSNTNSKKLFTNPVIATPISATSTRSSRSENTFQLLTRSQSSLANPITPRSSTVNAPPSYNNSPKTATPRRIALVSLPLDPKNMRYNSSSEDEIPYLTINRNKNNVHAQQTSTNNINNSAIRHSSSPSSSSFSDNKLFGFTNTNSQSLDFASLRETGALNFVGTPSSSSYHAMLSSPITSQPPPYSKNQLMGKN